MDRTELTLRRSAFSPANAIYIVDCLSEVDQQTGRSRLTAVHNLLLARDPEKFDYEKNFARRLEVISAAQFAECFREIIDECELGIKPTIFIDAHGDPVKGLVMPSGEFVGWSKLLGHLNRVIQRTEGGLTVIVAACHSMVAVQNLSPQGRLPFAFYYGYPSEVQTGVLAEETKFIVESVLGDRGRAVFNARHLQLQCFSEYDHIELELSILLLMASMPAFVASKLPEFSRAEIRAMADRANAAKGRPLSGARKSVNAKLNSGLQAIQFIEKQMHDTLRRDRVIEDIQAYIHGHALPPIPIE